MVFVMVFEGLEGEPLFFRTCPYGGGVHKQGGHHVDSNILQPGLLKPCSARYSEFSE